LPLGFSWGGPPFLPPLYKGGKEGGEGQKKGSATLWALPIGPPRRIQGPLYKGLCNFMGSAHRPFI